jgi:hypothetical protein
VAGIARGGGREPAFPLDEVSEGTSSPAGRAGGQPREDLMKFVCLIYSDETDPATHPEPGTPEFGAMMAAYQSFGKTAGERVVTGAPLEKTDTATSVRVRNDEVIATDGPFAETKEQLGGFYLLDCDTRDEALELAAKIPHASMGTIEVRAVPQFD